MIPLENITVPTAMIVGKADKLADPQDAEWTRDTIGKAVIHYQEVEGGHLTFMIAKDMTYWTTDVMNILNTYSPLPKAELYL